MLLDYSPSHSQLVFRSLPNKLRDYNIDIIFNGVITLLIPTDLKGIEISLTASGIKRWFLIKKYRFQNKKKGYKIFSLKNSHSQIYFVNASSFGVFHNKLDILETSLGRYDSGNLTEKIFRYIG